MVQSRRTTRNMLQSINIYDFIPSQDNLYVIYYQSYYYYQTYGNYGNYGNSYYNYFEN